MGLLMPQSPSDVATYAGIKVFKPSAEAIAASRCVVK